jgi:hypothetical protein
MAMGKVQIGHDRVLGGLKRVKVKQLLALVALARAFHRAAPLTMGPKRPPLATTAQNHDGG